MPHIRTCSKCMWNYTKKHHGKWPRRQGKYMATYKLELNIPNANQEDLLQLKDYWCRTWYKDSIEHQYFEACDKCVSPEAAKIMTYYPNGWQELSKNEAAMESCVIS